MELGSRDVDDFSEVKQAIPGAFLNECDKESKGDNKSDGEEIFEREHESKPPQECLGKCASFSSAVVSTPPKDDVGIETALPQIMSENSLHSPYPCSLTLPTPLKLVSALKGSREKRGLSPKNLTVTWAPDVYDPPPTSVLHTIGSKRQQKSKKKNEKKKNGKKGRKGNTSSRGSSSGGGSGKDNKQFHRGSGTTDRCYKPLEVVDRIANASGDLDDFNVGSPDPSFCGSSFLKKSPTRMHYSVTEAL